MTRLVVAVFSVLLTLLPGLAFGGPADDASAVIDRWAAAFNAHDVDALTRLYASDALLHGTTSPELRIGSSAIHDYFKGLPASTNSVKIGERHITVLGDAAAMAVGFYDFKAGPSRFTFVLVKRGDDWLIAHQHSSRLPPESH